MLHNVRMDPTLTGVGARLTLSAIGLFLASSAHANLGGDAASVVADRAEMNGSLATYSRPRFTIQAIATDSGMLVREFSTPNGMVFAISWSGPALPDLQRLFGASYVGYVRALSQLKRPGLKRSVRLASDSLIVEQEGHLRAYIGRAILPAMLPAGVTLAQLR
jgi:hypothetical protein